MSVLQEPGDLARTPLAALLIAALNEKASGVLTVERPQGTARLYLRAGMPVGAQTFLGFKPLGQHLLQRGLIDMVVLNESLGRMARTHEPQGRILVEMGAIDQPTLERVLAEQQEEYLALVAGLDAGAYRFDPNAPVPEWTAGVRISPLKAIVDALVKPQARQLVQSALPQPEAGPLALTPEYRQVADKFGWSAVERDLVGRLEAPVEVGAFLDAGAAAPERARAILAALLLLGLAEPVAAPAGDSLPASLDGDLATAGGPAAPPEAEVPPERAGPSATAVPGPGEGRRGDPDEARRRRQRLLARAIQNMGVAPLTPPPSQAPAAAPPPGAEAGRPPAATRAAATDSEAALRRAFQEIRSQAANPDYFARLGVPHGAPPEAVKQAYLGLARQFHPDRFLKPALSDLTPAVKELFAAFNEAYATLSDATRRGEYMARRAAARAAGSSAAASEGAVEAARIDFQKGEACARTRDYPKARAFFEAAIRDDPANAEYKAALAATYLTDPRGRDLARAKQLLAEAMRDPRCDRAFLVAAQLARAEKDEVRAERLFRLALKANPRNGEAAREVHLIDEQRRRKGEDRALSKK